MPRILRIVPILLLAAVILLAAGIVLTQPDDEPSEAAAERLADLGLLLEEDNDGLYVLAVREHSPALRAGFAPGDRLTAFGDAPVIDARQLETAYAQHPRRTPLTFVVRRGGELLTLTILFRRTSP